MSIRVRKAGILSSLQDCGRIGFRRYGVPVSGSMDQHAAAVANLLAGNHREEAVIEITLHGLQVEFLQDSLVAFAGGGSRPFVGNRAIDINKAVWILKGSVIDFRYHEPRYVQDASIFIAGDHFSDHRFPVILVEAEL